MVKVRLKYIRNLQKGAYAIHIIYQDEVLAIKKVIIGND